MDFRNCPACKASVLEDDAVDCPFCGASMTTGKPSGTAQPTSSKAAPAKPVGATPAVKPPAGKVPTGKPSPGKPVAKGKADSGDPFDVDTSAARRATPVKPRPAKGYMIRIACPMCERAGFISEAEIGKDVKCCNPDCLVPVFVANPPREKEPEPVPVASGGGKLWLYGGLAVIVVGGLVVTMLLNRVKPPSGSDPIAVTPVTPQPGTTSGPGTQDPQTPAAEQPAVQPLTPKEIVTRSITEMEKAAEQAEGLRERDLAARLLAEAHPARRVRCRPSGVGGWAPPRSTPPSGRWRSRPGSIWQPARRLRPRQRSTRRGHSRVAPQARPGSAGHGRESGGSSGGDRARRRCPHAHARSGGSRRGRADRPMRTGDRGGTVTTSTP